MKALTSMMMALLVSNFVWSQNITEPIKYNDFIIELQNEIGKKILIFNEQMALDGMTYENIQPYLDDLINTAASCETRLTKLNVLENDPTLKNTALDLFKFYVRCFKTTYVDLTKIVFQSELSEEDLTKLQSLMEQITNEEKGYDQAFQEAQRAFAKKHKFELINNELQESLED